MRRPTQQLYSLKERIIDSGFVATRSFKSITFGWSKLAHAIKGSICPDCSWPYLRISFVLSVKNTLKSYYIGDDNDNKVINKDNDN